MSLLQSAQQVLKDNDIGSFIKPSYSQYPHIWNWDTAFIAIGLSHYDMQKAEFEVKALLTGQWQNGMLPHILYLNGASDYFPSPDFWQTDGRATFLTSGFTQPPILATAVRMMFKRSNSQKESLEFIKEVYPKILSWHSWLYKARDPENTGLVAIIHPWESGTDDSPRFTEALADIQIEDLPSFERSDQVHVQLEERPNKEDYQRFVYLIDVYRKLQWDDVAIYKQAPFLVVDIMFNSILYQANMDLLELARALGKPTSQIEAWLQKAKQAFETLWDEKQGLYFDKNLRSNRLLKENTAMAFSPLYAGLANKEKAAKLVKRLLNKNEYAASDSHPFFMPSVAKNNQYFEAQRYWRGPIWINMNWLLWRGLKRYGYLELAKKTKDNALQLIESYGFVEYYDARNGSARGAKGFSWTAALAIDMLVSHG